MQRSYGSLDNRSSVARTGCAKNLILNGPRIVIRNVSSLRCLNDRTTCSGTYLSTKVFGLGEAEITDSLVNQQIKLSDGRMLGFAEYGIPDGKPIFYFHGHPGSRLDWPGLIHDGVDVELNARVIAVDRPGHGLSDFYRDRKLLDWPDDVVELADALSLDRFAVLGVSGGGPYAAACAFKIPERLTTTAIVCGMGPVESPGCKDGLSWIYAGKVSLTRRLLLMLTSIGLRKQPDKFISAINEGMKGPDKALILEKPELVKNIANGFGEAFRSGVTGVHLEAGLCKSPWGFRLQDISAEVHLWHGEQDNNVLVSVGRYIADAIPNCHARFMEDEGHLTLIHNCVREYLSVLVD